MLRRFDSNPIITPDLSPTLGDNINGPSLIRVPPWLSKPLGRYYLYFGHHKGSFIRLAYADALAGPWSIYEPGTLQLDSISAETGFHKHIASPDVHVDDDRQQLRLYFHAPYRGAGQQLTGVAASRDGIDFRLLTRQPLGTFYFRVFQWAGQHYAVGKYKNDCGQLFRSADGITPFDTLCDIIPNMRHAAVLVQKETLYLFYTVVGHAPERILVATVDLRGEPSQWTPSEPLEVARPARDYEGTSYPLKPSRFGAQTHVQQLRDPAVFQEDGNLYLLYSVAGECGIAMGQLRLPFRP